MMSGVAFGLGLFLCYLSAAPAPRCLIPRAPPDTLFVILYALLPLLHRHLSPSASTASLAYPTPPLLLQLSEMLVTLANVCLRPASPDSEAADRVVTVMEDNKLQVWWAELVGGARERAVASARGGRFLSGLLESNGGEGRLQQQQWQQQQAATRRRCTCS